MEGEIRETRMEREGERERGRKKERGGEREREREREREKAVILCSVTRKADSICRHMNYSRKGEGGVVIDARGRKKAKGREITGHLTLDV